MWVKLVISIFCVVSYYLITMLYNLRDSHNTAEETGLLLCGCEWLKHSRRLAVGTLCGSQQQRAVVNTVENLLLHV